MMKQPWKVINTEEERRDGLERLSTRQECGSTRIRGTKGGRERGVQALTKAGQRRQRSGEPTWIGPLGLARTPASSVSALISHL